MVSTVAVIPVKSFRGGKLRLSPAIDDAKRHSLATGFATHVATTVEGAGLRPLIVTADDEVTNWATSSGYQVLSETGEGLNSATRTGADWATANDSRWVVIFSDLPLLRSDDLTPFLDTTHDVIAPSADGGTSGIASRSMIDFAFGPGSFHKHLARLASPRIIISTGWLHDIDSPNDLESAMNHSRGRWIAEHTR